MHRSPPQPVVAPPADVSSSVASLLDGLGLTWATASPTLRVLAHSPPALATLATLSAATGTLSVARRTRIAIALRVAALHGCAAVPSPETKDGGVDGETAERYCRGISDDPREQALLALAGKVVADRGRHLRFVVQAARSVGASDAEIIETVVLAGLHTTASYLHAVSDVGPNSKSSDGKGST